MLETPLFSLQHTYKVHVPVIFNCFSYNIHCTSYILLWMIWYIRFNTCSYIYIFLKCTLIMIQFLINSTSSSFDNWFFLDRFRGELASLVLTLSIDWCWKVTRSRWWTTSSQGGNVMWNTGLVMKTLSWLTMTL